MSQSKILKKAIDDIEKHGWHVVSVACKDTLSFSYTVGFKKTLNHPEIFVSGLSIELMHDLLNDIGELIHKGTVFNNGDLSYEVVKDLPVKFIKVKSGPLSEYLRVAGAYYGNEIFEALQCVWPDKNGSFQKKSDNTQEIIG
jgi:hypothetical protein